MALKIQANCHPKNFDSFFFEISIKKYPKIKKIGHDTWLEKYAGIDFSSMYIDFIDSFCDQIVCQGGILPNAFVQ